MRIKYVKNFSNSIIFPYWFNGKLSIYRIHSRQRYLTDTTTYGLDNLKNRYHCNDFTNFDSNSNETIPNPFKYVGRYGVITDLPDLLYMRARYYVPSVGRFIAKDPIGLAGGLNLYGYVGENPINKKDSLGLQVIQPVPIAPFPVSVPLQMPIFSNYSLKPNMHPKDDSDLPHKPGIPPDWVFIICEKLCKKFESDCERHWECLDSCFKFFGYYGVGGL